MRATCENCGAPRDGPYCGQCGQSEASLDLPATEFARDVASEAFGLDSRVRHTMWPLVARPGLVAREYVSGHRARFVPPIRLYLLTSLFMFVVMSFGDLRVSTVEVGGRQVTADSIGPRPGEEQESSANEAAGAPEAPAGSEAQDEAESVGDGDRASQGTFMLDLGVEQLNDRLARGMQQILTDPTDFNRIFIDRLAKAMFVLLPLFALFLKFFWWRRLYVHHMVFAIYFHSFVFLVVGFTGLPEIVGLDAASRWLDLLMLTVPVYLALALRRFYGDGWPRTLFKATALSLTYGVIGIVAVVTLLIVSVLSV